MAALACQGAVCDDAFGVKERELSGPDEKMQPGSTLPV
jgi:hypothetical protein